MKEKYFQYSLVILILFLGWLIVSNLWTFASGLLGAVTIYVLVHGQMTYLTEKRRIKPIFAAIIIILEVIAVVFVPVYFLVWILVGRIQDINLDITELIDTLKHLIALIEENTGYDLLSVSNIETATGFLTKGVQILISQAGNLIITVVVMIFLLFFMLISRKTLEGYVYDLLPFSERNKHDIMTEIHNMVRSNAIGMPLLATIQGIIAFIGYWIMGVTNPVLYGVLTVFVSIVPIIGTGIVWFPLVVYLALTGNWPTAIGLFAYCALILTNIDNVIRFTLQKKMADTHPLVTVFGVIMGIRLFGFWGIIFGPLLLSMFFMLVNIFKREYLDSSK